MIIVTFSQQKTVAKTKMFFVNTKVVFRLWPCMKKQTAFIRLNEKSPASTIRKMCVS